MTIMLILGLSRARRALAVDLADESGARSRRAVLASTISSEADGSRARQTVPSYRAILVYTSRTDG